MQNSYSNLSYANVFASNASIPPFQVNSKIKRKLLSISSKQFAPLPTNTSPIPNSISITLEVADGITRGSHSRFRFNRSANLTLYRSSRWSCRDHYADATRETRYLWIHHVRTRDQGECSSSGFPKRWRDGTRIAGNPDKQVRKFPPSPQLTLSLAIQYSSFTHPTLSVQCLAAIGASQQFIFAISSLLFCAWSDLCFCIFWMLRCCGWFWNIFTQLFGESLGILSEIFQ